MPRIEFYEVVQSWLINVADDDTQSSKEVIALTTNFHICAIKFIMCKFMRF